MPEENTKWGFDDFFNQILINFGLLTLCLQRRGVKFPCCCCFLNKVKFGGHFKRGVYQSGNNWLRRNSPDLGKFEKLYLGKSPRYGEMGKLKFSSDFGKFSRTWEILAAKIKPRILTKIYQHFPKWSRSVHE